MDNNIIFKDKKIKHIDNYDLGISGENEQETLLFSFEDDFMDGTCFLELELPGGKKGLIELERVDSCYRLEVKNSLLGRKGPVRMQLKVVNGTMVWKSVIFEMHVVEAINAIETLEDDYPNFVDWAKIRLNDLEEAIKQVSERVNSFGEIEPEVWEIVKDIRQTDIDNWNGKSDFSGDYNDLLNKPDLSTFVTESDLNDKLGEIDTLLTNIVVESEAI